jgi:hypothetical protein
MEEIELTICSKQQVAEMISTSRMKITVPALIRMIVDYFWPTMLVSSSIMEDLGRFFWVNKCFNEGHPLVGGRCICSFLEYDPPMISRFRSEEFKAYLRLWNEKKTLREFVDAVPDFVRLPV